MSNSKTLKSVDLPPLTADNKKPFTVNTKANIVNFWLCNESSATVFDPVIWEK